MADKGALSLVRQCLVLLKSAMFPKALPTANNITSKFIFAIMNGLMPPQPSPRNKALPTSFPGTEKFTDTRVS